MMLDNRLAVTTFSRSTSPDLIRLQWVSVCSWLA